MCMNIRKVLIANRGEIACPANLLSHVIEVACLGSLDVIVR